jgi:hypothetical protein
MLLRNEFRQTLSAELLRLPAANQAVARDAGPSDQTTLNNSLNP